MLDVNPTCGAATTFVEAVLDQEPATDATFNLLVTWLAEHTERCRFCQDWKANQATLALHRALPFTPDEET